MLEPVTLSYLAPLALTAVTKTYIFEKLKESVESKFKDKISEYCYQNGKQYLKNFLVDHTNEEDANHDLQKGLKSAMKASILEIQRTFFIKEDFHSEYKKNTIKKINAEILSEIHNSPFFNALLDNEFILEFLDKRNEYNIRAVEEIENNFNRLDNLAPSYIKYFTENFQRLTILYFGELLKEENEECKRVWIAYQKNLFKEITDSQLTIKETVNQNKDLLNQINQQILILQQNNGKKVLETIEVEIDKLRTEISINVKSLSSYKQLLPFIKVIDGKLDQIILNQLSLASGQDIIVSLLNEIIENQNKETPVLIKKHLSQISTPDYFIGRDQDLINIRAALENKEQITKQNKCLLLVNGEGGIGKTTVAANYCKRYDNYYKHIAWVFAENSIQDALMTLANALNIQFPETADQTQRFDTLMLELRNLTAPCLLVIDNANDLQDLKANEQVLNSLDNFHVLITTRVNEMNTTQFHPINPLSINELKALFCQFYPKHHKKDNKILKKIIKATGKNTLVVELLAKSLKRLNRAEDEYTLENLLEDLQEKGLLKVETTTVDTKYQNYIEAKPKTIIAAMYDLEELNVEERKILSAFSVLPAVAISYKLLKQILAGILELQDNLFSLADKGWLMFNEKNTTFKTSPVIQEVCRNKNVKLEEDLVIIVKNLTRLLDYDSSNHIINITYSEASEVSNFGSILSNYSNIDDIGMLLERVGNYHKITGDLQKALGFFEKQALFYEKHDLTSPKNVKLKNSLAISFSKIGQIHTGLGNLQIALNFFEKRSVLSEQLYEFDPDNINFKNGLAISYEKLGQANVLLKNLKDALMFFEKRSVLGKELFEAFPDDKDFKNGLAISYSKLGQTHSDMGNFQQALKFFEKRSELGKQLYYAFPDNVGFKNGLAISYSKLGQTHYNLDDFQQALKYFEEYNSLTQQLSNAYPDNVNFKNGLALSFYKLAQVKEKFSDDKQAIKYFKKAKFLWNDLNVKFSDYVKFSESLAMVNSDIERLSN